MKGFKIVGDNVDKTINPRYMHTDRSADSCHYYQAYAIKDRVDVTHLGDKQPLPPTPTAVDSASKLILPNKADDCALTRNFKIYIARVLIRNCAFFKVAFICPSYLSFIL